MTNLTKCLKPSGSCSSKKEEFAEYSGLAIFLKKKWLPTRHYVVEYIVPVHAMLSWLILMHVCEIKCHLIIFIKAFILKCFAGVHLHAVEAGK